MLIPANYDRHLVYLNSEGKQVSFKVIAFDVDDKSNVKPITFPSVPKAARCFSVEADGFRLFDLATGIASGHGLIQPE